MPAEEIDEAIEEATPIPNGLPESPASLTVRFWVDDYGVMLTMRGNEVRTIVKQLEWVIDFAKKKGWKSKWSEKTTVFPKSREAKANQETCSHVQFKVAQVKKEGANKGKWFKICTSCSKFLGWVKV